MGRRRRRRRLPLIGIGLAAVAASAAITTFQAARDLDMVTKLLGGLFALRFRDRWFEALAEHGPAVALLALGSALICIGVMRRVR